MSLPDPTTESVPPRALSRRDLVRLLVLFGTLYFVQGVIEPTAGLASQPMQSQLRGWGYSAEQIGYFSAIIGIAWSIKPLFGLLSDFFPIAGYRRWPYLVLSTAGAGAAFLGIAAVWGRDTGGGPADSIYRWLAGIRPDQFGVSQSGWLLLAVGISIAMTDVVVDAMAVEEGQPKGLTGQIQSVQWGALSVAGILAGSLGGFFAQRGWQREMFALCGLLGLISLGAVLLLARERRGSVRPTETVARAFAELWNGRRLAILAAVAVFLFLWNFNPFSSNVMQHYVTEELGLSEQFYGNLLALISAAQAVACVVYFWICRRVPLGWLIHLSIVSAVISTLCFAPMHNAATAVVASIVFGITYQLANLVTLDLAARTCATESAGTVFALLMAISNTGITLGIHFGGRWYDQLTAALQSRHQAFDVLVLIGAAFTAACWLLVPVMKRAGVEWR